MLLSGSLPIARSLFAFIHQPGLLSSWEAGVARVSQRSRKYPTDLPNDNLIEAILQWRFPLLR